jgi:hypothetical protein
VHAAACNRGVAEAACSGILLVKRRHGHDFTPLCAHCFDALGAAGGSVMACLMRPPAEAEQGSDAAALTDWLGPNYM